jgi:hypothetical protein
MNTLNKVYSKLNKKTELATHKVDLGLVDELKTIQKESTNAYVDYIDDMDTSKGYLSQAKKKATKAVQLLKESIKIYNEVQSKFEELGVDMPSELKKQTPKPALDEAEKDLSMMTSIFSKFKVR